MSAIVTAITVLIMAGVSLYLIGTMVVGIRKESRDPKVSPWKDFGLSISLVLLFLVSWLGHGLSQWQAFTDEQREHKEPVEVGDFLTDFSQSTLENWQSEFLQLFSFVVLAAVLIHRGSAESKDSDERMEAALDRIEKRLDDLENRDS